MAVIDGKTVLAGNERLLNERGIATADERVVLEQLATEGKTVSVLAVDGKVAGVIAVADTIKPNSKKAITALKALGLQTIMLTGDNKRVAQSVADELGLDRFSPKCCRKKKKNM